MTGASERDWTTAEAIAHGRQWLAAGWIWMPGQVILIVVGDGSAVRTVVCALYDGRPVHVAHYGGGPLLGARGVCAPDMRDPGTRGHDLYQVRAMPGVWALDINEEDVDNGDELPFRVRVWGGSNSSHSGGSLSEVLLAARMAAP